MSWRKGFIGMFSVVGVGYGIMKLTVPDAQKIYDSLSESEKKIVDKKRETVKKDWALVVDFIKSNANSDRPAWDVQIPPHVLEANERISQASNRKN